MYVIGPDNCLATYANSTRKVLKIDTDTGALAYDKLTDEIKGFWGDRGCTELTSTIVLDLSDLLQNAELAEDFGNGIYCFGRV